MKKTIKIIALCLSLVALTALFAGCDALDEMQANHAILSEDKESISFRGDTYKRLPEGANFYYTYKFTEDIDVTDDDVPVLLSDAYCYYSEYDNTKDLFRVNLVAETTEDFFVSSYSSVVESVYYCNEKDYDKYVTAIEENNPDHIGFEYEVEDEIENEGFYYYYTLEVASKEVSDEILGHITNPEKMTDELFDEKAEDYSLECLMCSMYKCDADGVLAEILDGYDIQRDSEGNAYLMNYITEKAVRLSDKTAEALKDVYFYGDYQHTDWYDDDSDLGIIGSADNEEFIVVEEKYL